MSRSDPPRALPLRVRRVAIDTHPESTAFLLRSGNRYRAEQFRALRKIEVRRNGARLLASLMITDDPSIVGPDEVGLGEQAFRRFGMPEGTAVRIAQATPPGSLEAVRQKVAGGALSEADIVGIVNDIAAHRYEPTELAAFVVGCAGFMTTSETLALTRAMADAGERLEWDAPLVVDKHCVGGLPGNRTSMIVVPIVAAHGLTIPKTSSRAITSPSGTADTMEVLARVDLTAAQMKEIVAREHAVLAWGGRVNLSPADDVLISVERPLRIDTFEQMVASIVSKKLAAGSTHLLIDIPVGPTAKVRSQREAVRLRKLFEYVGREVGLVVDVLLTDGTQPVGRGIGPVLEVRDVMAVLRNDNGCPDDLRERALLLAGRILDFDPALPGGSGHARASDLLASGQALAAMERIIDAQGRHATTIDPGPLIHEVKARSSGTVAAIDCHLIARVARLAGAPMDKGAGIDLLRKVGETVRRGEPLYRIFACHTAEIEFARDLAAADNGYTLVGG